MGKSTDSTIAAPQTLKREAVPMPFGHPGVWLLRPDMLTVAERVAESARKSVSKWITPPRWLKQETLPQLLAAALAVIVAADLGFMMRRPRTFLAVAMPASALTGPAPYAEPDPPRVTTTTSTTQPVTLTVSQPLIAKKTQHVATDGMGIWSCIIRHESGGDPHAVNRSSGAGGLFQFLPSSWRAYGGSGSPQDASVDEQWRVAHNAYARSGFSPWRGDGCV
jgi:hypothetical protein